VAAPDNFGWLGDAPSVFQLVAAPDNSGWWRRCESSAEGSSWTASHSFCQSACNL